MVQLLFPHLLLAIAVWALAAMWCEAQTPIVLNPRVIPCIKTRRLNCREEFSYKDMATNIT